MESSAPDLVNARLDTMPVIGPVGPGEIPADSAGDELIAGGRSQGARLCPPRRPRKPLAGFRL